MTVSVIVPAFNVDAYVTACLESLRAAVRAASGPSCEVLCVNDGSTDGTARLLDDFRERAGDDPCFRVRVWHLPNRGVAAARTFALEKAVGSWFAFVDADDLVSPDCFSSFLAGLSAYPDADLVRVGTSPFEDGTLPAWSGTGRVSLLDIRADLPAPLTMFGFTEMLYRASKFRDVRFEEFRVGEDIVFSARCFARADSIAVVDRTLTDIVFAPAAACMARRPSRASKDRSIIWRRCSVCWRRAESRCHPLSPAAAETSGSKTRRPSFYPVRSIPNGVIAGATGSIRWRLRGRCVSFLRGSVSSSVSCLPRAAGLRRFSSASFRIC